MARGASNLAFPTVRTEGLLLPPELLGRVAELDPKLPGLTPSDYHLPEGERINEATNRAWNRLTTLWTRFRKELTSLSPSEAGTGQTRERWLMPMFQELGYGRLQRQPAVEVAGKAYAISHVWENMPIHLVGAGLDLDKRTKGQAGAAQASPHGLLQEFLNRSEAHAWGLVSNGLKLRILRDNASLTRQAYVEFDLAAIMDGELYADFRLLWLLCHQSRVEGEQPEQCWLEKWSQDAQQQGARALEHLREGVEKAIAALGSGFLAHRANTWLQSRLASGELSTQDYYRQLLRLVYRLIFLFVAEDRDLLLLPDADKRAKHRYREYFSTARLRRIAGKLKGGRHDDLYEGLKVVTARLYETGCPELALPALGSALWAPDKLSDLTAGRIANRALLDAVRALAFTQRDRTLRPVDYRNLGPEELGSVYESLLELHPEVHREAATFGLKVMAGSERKTTGSYYTPSSLINELLNSALDPILDQAASAPDPERAILELDIVDPAAGSGHFLVAAAHRIAHRLAAVRTREAEPAPAEVSRALRDVVGHCIHGVDVNEMAVELCKVSLWMTAMESGRPLSFLDHRVRQGNSLLGATPELIAGGLPDDAFKPIEGDETTACAALKRRNKQEREGQQDMLHLMATERDAEYNSIAARTHALDQAPDATVEQVQRKADQFDGLVASQEYQHTKQIADAWCAAFVWRKRGDVSADPITTDTMRRLAADPRALSSAQRHEVERLAHDYQFFHWHLAFPDVFLRGGFDCVLGNPPWEHTELKEKEWFAERRPDIASARTGAERKRKIETLKVEDPPLYFAFGEALRGHNGVSHFLSNGGRYPLCGRGRINLYAVFAEAMRSLLNEHGRVGCVLPTGIATDDTTRFFFQDVVEKESLVSLFDFENKQALFAGVHAEQKFCLFTAGRGARPTAESAKLVFFAHTVADLRDPERRFTLSSEEIALLNPNTRTCPIFRSRRDAELTLAIHRRVLSTFIEIRPGIIT